MFEKSFNSQPRAAGKGSTAQAEIYYMHREGVITRDRVLSSQIVVAMLQVLY
jgi:hypothetical protein